MRAKARISPVQADSTPLARETPIASAIVTTVTGAGMF